MSVYDLTGRKALVTGGARGLGAGTAAALARAGAAVVIGDILEDLGQATADELKKSGATASFLPLDVTNDASWELAISDTIRELGGLDILVNNAGVEITSLIVDLDPDDIRKMLEVNVLGTSLGHQARLPRHAPGWPGGPRRRGGQHLLGRRHHRLPRHRGLLRDQVRGRPADPGGGHGVRQARLRRPGELHLSRPGPHRDGQPAGPGRGDVSGCSPAWRRPSAPWWASPRRAAWARSRTWPTRWCSSPPTRPASSPAPACPSTAAWACERED